MNPLKLLIIDDDPDQLQLLQGTISAHFKDAHVLGVTSAQSALAQDLRALDLILCDYNLPDSSGLDLLQQILRRCTTPVIMVTGENVGRIAVDAVMQGAVDYVVKTGDYLFTIPLIIEKNMSLARMKRQLQDQNNQLSQLATQLAAAAATDPLTGLYNRRHFSSVLDQLHSEADRHGHDLAAVMIDLDGFKQLNDTRGHQMGDQLLGVVAKTITANLRRYDVAARYGGDEFVLLLPHTGSREASDVADRIRGDYCIRSAEVLCIATGMTMSVGISSVSDHRPGTGDRLISLADQALYNAKRAGRNRICIPPAAMNAIGAKLRIPA